MTRTPYLAALGTFLLAASVSFAGVPDVYSPAINPIDPVSYSLAAGPAHPLAVNPVPRVFSDLNDLFGFVAHTRGVGNADDPALVRQISAGSSVTTLHDGSNGPVLVVKANLRDRDGSSRLRSPNGNYPFYVLRSTPSGLVLLGTMFGTDYTSHFDGRALRFEMKLNTAPGKNRTLSFQVEQNSLVNLSARPCASPACGVAS